MRQLGGAVNRARARIPTKRDEVGVNLGATGGRSEIRAGYVDDAWATPIIARHC